MKNEIEGETVTFRLNISAAQGALSLVLFFVALTAWAFASPAGSSPDDNFHLASIWCGQGERDGICNISEGQQWSTPENVYEASSCFAYHPEISASCQQSAGEIPTKFVIASHSNQDHSYPQGFYGTLSNFASTDLTFSVLMMRLVNIVILLLMTATLYVFSPSANRRPLLWGMIFTFVPLGMFIVPSTNPSSWALTSAAIYWVALKGFFETRGRQKFVLALLAIASALLGSSARADSGVFIILASFFVLLHSGIGKLREKSNFILVTFIFGLVLTFVLSSGQIHAVDSGLTSGESSSFLTKYTLPLWLINLGGQPWLWSGALGTWPLGWLDTPLPLIVPITSICAALIATTWSMHRTQSWKKLWFILPWLTLVLVPYFILMKSNKVIGTEVQPRYILPLITIAIGMSFLSSQGKRTPMWLVVIATTLLSIGNSVGLLATLQRYIFGSESPYNIFSSPPDWWWTVAPLPAVIWAAGSISFAFGLYFVMQKTRVSEKA